MRVRQDTPDRLVLEERPWVLGAGLALGVVVFSAVGLATVMSAPWLGLAMFGGAALFGLLFAVLVRRTIAIFDRTAGAMVLRSVSLFGTTETTLPLARIRGALVQTSHASGTGSMAASRTHRVALRLEGAEPLPLTVVHSAGPGAARAAEAIDCWLDIRG